jgi:hypothetical protein
VARDEGAISREPLSPELVLVCPEIRLKALDALSDRPWEAFLPPRREDSPAAIAGPASITSGSLVVVPSEAVAEPIDDLGGSTTASVSRRRRDIALVMIALILGFATAEFVDRQSRPAPTRTAEASPSAAPAPRQTVAAPSTSPTGGPRKTLAVARGGYIFGRSGRFQIAADLGTVRMFRAQVKCARILVIPAISLHDGSRFGYRGQIRAGKKPAVQLEVAGRFLDSSRVRGFVHAHSLGCDSGKVRFLARLS